MQNTFVSFLIKASTHDLCASSSCLQIMFSDRCCSSSSSSLSSSSSSSSWSYNRIIAISLIKFPPLVVEFSQAQRKDGPLRPVSRCDTNESPRLDPRNRFKGEDFSGFSPRFLSSKEQEDRSRRSNARDIDRQGLSRGRGCEKRNDVGRYSPEERRIPDATREY